MTEIEDKLMKKLSPKDYDLARQIINLPVSKIRKFIQEKADETEAR